MISKTLQHKTRIENITQAKEHKTLYQQKVNQQVTKTKPA